MKRLIFASVATLALGLASCGGGSTDKDGGCATDSDCKGDRVCDGGSCVSPGGGNNGGNNTNPNNGGNNTNPNNGGNNTNPNNGGNNAAMCEGPDDCSPINCPCRDGDVSTQSCLFGACATMSACTEVCEDNGGVRMDTDCDGDWSLGDTPFVSGENLIGNECDGVPPQNCIDGFFIQKSDGCFCTPECASAVGVGGDCTNDGSWTCQQVASTNGNDNSATICVHSSWNLCGPE